MTAAFGARPPAQPSPAQPPPVVWLVDSAYTGELKARRGLALRLGFGYDIIPLPDGDDHAYQRLLKQKHAAADPAAPLIVISGTGEETTAQIADLRAVFRQQLVNVYLASILPEPCHPRLNEYDLIASPQIAGANVVTLTGVPHSLTTADLAAARHRHAQTFAALAKPVTAVLVGGNTRYCQGFSERHARRLAVRIAALVGGNGGSLLVSNSRRTPATALAALLDGLAALRPRFFDWRQHPEDVYLALLAHADLFIVTGDSLSMCSEAAFTGKPVYVDLSAEATEDCHRDILGRLIAHGAARPLSGPLSHWRYPPPDPTRQVADAIVERFLAAPAPISP